VLGLRFAGSGEHISQGLKPHSFFAGLWHG
jgi:hypothetical protein